MVSRPLPVDAIRTSISLGYRNDRVSLIADDVLPPVPVSGEKFSWTYLPVGQAFTVPPTVVGRRGRVERVEFKGTKQTGETTTHGLEDSIPQSDLDEAKAMRDAGLGDYDPLDTATELLTDLLLIAKEARVAGVVQNPSNYAINNRLTLSGADQLSNDESDIVQILKSAFNSTLVFRPNTMTMGRDTWGAISSHPKLVNAIKGNMTGEGVISPDQFVQLFSGEGLKKLLIGEAFINTERLGQAPVLRRIWGNSISLTYINPAARPEYGATFGMQAAYGRRFVGSWFDKDIGLDGGVVLRVGERIAEIVTCPEAGFLIQNAVSIPATAITIPPGR